MTRRIATASGALALQLIALVLAHDLTFLARYGSRYGEELAHAGHGQTWTAAVASAAVLTIVLLALATGRLLQLRARVRREEGAWPGVARESLGHGFADTWLRLSIRIGVLGVGLLTIQENVERVAIGQVAPGPGVLLSPAYPFGLWIAIAVGAVVAFVAALFVHRQRTLLARLRAARQSLRHAGAAPAGPRWRRGEVSSTPESLLGRRSGLRAPPAAVPA